MMDLDTLRYVNNKATREAAREKRVPLIIEEEDKEAARRGDLSGLRIPFIGYRRPRGYRKIAELFVDKTGFGAANEPALTIEQFVEKIVPGYAYAVVEDGQFQCYVGEYEVLSRR